MKKTLTARSLILWHNSMTILVPITLNLIESLAKLKERMQKFRNRIDNIEYSCNITLVAH